MSGEYTLADIVHAADDPPHIDSRQRAEAVAARLVTEQHDRPSLVSTITQEVAAESIEDIPKPVMI